MKDRGLLALLLATIVGAQGCAEVGLTLFGVGAGVTAGTGTTYTLDSVASRTFTVPIEVVRRATLSALKRMEIAVESDEVVDEGRRIVGRAQDRTIEITLERLTAKATRMRVAARQGWFFKDRATAGEIIAQTEKGLDRRQRV